MEYDVETNKKIASTINRIVGPTILLGSGTYFDFEDPDNSNITIEDIAYGLAYECRFSGQCVSSILNRRVYYSVAEHCVRMSLKVPQEYAYDALMHETGEAPCGDMSGPLKSICLDYKSVEKNCGRAIQEKFGVKMSNPTLIKHHDLRMLVTERRDLMPWKGESWSWAKGIEPYAERIIPWEDPNRAAKLFLKRYHELRV